MTEHKTKSGRVLTEDDIQALADEAERGYELVDGKWRANFLTPDEIEAIDLSAKLWNQLCKSIPKHLPNRQNDLGELVVHIHAIQQAVMSNAAARAYPGKYRALGFSLHQSPPPTAAPSSAPPMEVVPGETYDHPRGWIWGAVPVHRKDPPASDTPVATFTYRTVVHRSREGRGKYLTCCGQNPATLPYDRHRYTVNQAEVTCNGRPEHPGGQ